MNPVPQTPFTPIGTGTCFVTYKLPPSNGMVFGDGNKAYIVSIDEEQIIQDTFQKCLGHQNLTILTQQTIEGKRVTILETTLENCLNSMTWGLSDQNASTILMNYPKIHVLPSQNKIATDPFINLFTPINRQVATQMCLAFLSLFPRPDTQ